MFLLAHATFPRQHIKLAARILKDLPHLPASVRRKGPFFNLDNAERIKVLTFYSADTDSLAEIRRFLLHRYKPFAEVPHFTVNIQKWHEMGETLELLQHAAPPAPQAPDTPPP